MSQTDPPANNKNNNDNERRYCICQKSENELDEEDDNEDFMIECDGCNGWFHGRCVSLAPRIADDIEKYFCLECTKKHGPSIFKQRNNQHRRDYTDANANDKPMQSGTKDFINNLKRRTFLDCEPVIARLKGEQLTSEYLLKNGFTKPILIANRDGLELTLPDRAIALQEINSLIGPGQQVDIIDCEKQVIYKMSFREYVDYFESYDRSKIYNVLSLEVSNTKLGKSIILPKIVRDLSWATIGVWSNRKKSDGSKMKHDRTSDSTLKQINRRTVLTSTDSDQSDDDEDLKANHVENFPRPEVAKYCLISPQSSYTDFHIDFGGSSVWYSIVRGEKIFYLIEPTDENLQKYADWSNSPNESEIFLGDSVSHCYKLHIREGNTILLPPGWIHAVYTVTDSLVFGGNFLQSMGVDMQFRIYELERLAKVPQKFKYPLFETYHWFAAKYYYNQLRECNYSKSSTITPLLQQTTEAMLYHLNRWLTNDKRYQIRNRYIIPRGINCEKLLRDLAHELDVAKSRCGVSNNVKLPSKTTITSLNKRESVENGENKMKSKCPRISPMIEPCKTKSPIVGNEMKLTAKPKFDDKDRKSNTQEFSLGKIQKKKLVKSSSSISQKKNSEPTSPSRISYKLDFEAKRQSFMQDLQSMKNENDLMNDMDNFSKLNTDKKEKPVEVFKETPQGLAAFIEKPTVSIKQEQQSSIKQKILLSQKTKFKSSDIDRKLTKKVKIEFKKSSNSPITSEILTSIMSHSSLPTKKPLLPSAPIPKKLHTENRLGTMMKITDTLTSTGELLT